MTPRILQNIVVAASVLLMGAASVCAEGGRPSHSAESLSHEISAWLSANGDRMLALKANTELKVVRFGWVLVGDGIQRSTKVKEVLMDVPFTAETDDEVLKWTSSTREKMKLLVRRLFRPSESGAIMLKGSDTFISVHIPKVTSLMLAVAQAFRTSMMRW